MTTSTSSEAQKSWNGQTDKVRRYSVLITKKKRERTYKNSKKITKLKGLCLLKHDEQSNVFIY